MYGAEPKSRNPVDQFDRSRGSVIGATEAGIQQPQLEAVAERLQMCSNELSVAISTLEQRLQGVLNPEFKNETTASGVIPRPVRCPLGNTIESISDELHSAACRLHGLIERLAT